MQAKTKLIWSIFIYFQGRTTPLQPGQPAPSFKTLSVVSGGQFKEVSLEDFRGSYLVLFFYPLDL